MSSLTFGRWKIDHDVEATRAATAQVDMGAAEACGCLCCRNYVAARAEVWPSAAQDLFARLGIPYELEAEVYTNGKIGSGLHSYGAWFHFVGRIDEGSDAMIRVGPGSYRPELEPVAEHFSLGFTVRTALVPSSFPESSLVQVEVSAEVPWLL